MRLLDNTLPILAHRLYSNEQNLLEPLPSVVLLIGAVLLPGAKKPELIKRSMLKQMKPSTVFVVISIDQGGYAETSHPSTHEDPIYLEERIVHYCVGDMPGAYARTLTQALINGTLAYMMRISDLGFQEANSEVPELLRSVSTYRGHVTNKAVAKGHCLSYQELRIAQMI
jgi:alanine dehydrogenase